jgi:hypothetical protein
MLIRKIGGRRAAGGGTPAAFLYDFDENSSTTFEDPVTLYDAKLVGTGTVTSTVTGVPSGMDRWLNITSSAKDFESLHCINGEGDVTLEATVQFTTAASASFGIGLHDGLDGSSPTGEDLYVFFSGTDMFFRSGGANYDGPTASGITDGTTINLAMMIKSGTAYGFIDGVQLISQSLASMGVSFTRSCYAGLGYRYPGGGGLSGYFISSFRGFNRAIYDESGYTPDSLPLTTTI